jgi:hypothetical protein
MQVAHVHTRTSIPGLKRNVCREVMFHHVVVKGRAANKLDCNTSLDRIILPTHSTHRVASKSSFFFLLFSHVPSDPTAAQTSTAGNYSLFLTPTPTNSSATENGCQIPSTSLVGLVRSVRRLASQTCFSSGCCCSPLWLLVE